MGKIRVLQDDKPDTGIKAKDTFTKLFARERTKGLSRSESAAATVHE
jgi:hypothetical protein